MMKLRKILSGVAALSAVTAMMSVSALTTSAATITVTNAEDTKTYNAYKLFDATYGSGTTASYTATGAVASAINTYNTNYTDGVFILTEQATNAGTYNVTIRDGKNDADIIANIKKIFGDDAATGLSSPVTATASSDGTLSLTVSDAGYYYVTTTNGSVVSIDNVSDTVTVVDKNTKAGWLNDGKTVCDTADGTYAKANSAEIGDTVYFKIEASVPAYTDGKPVTSYTITDTIGTGFTVDENDVKVYFGETEATAAQATVALSGQTLTVTLTPTATDYPVNAEVKIAYPATVDKDAVLDNTNSAKLEFVTGTSGKTVDPTDTTPPADSATSTYVYGFKLNKYTGNTNTHLAGAKFRLYDAATEGNEIQLVAGADANHYRVAESGENGVEVVTTANSDIYIFGLEEGGTYYLEETEAPAGYNKLTARQQVTVLDGDKSTNATGYEATILTGIDENGYANTAVDVENKAGSLLPSTGGMGRKTLYAFGGFMTIAFSVIIAGKKRVDEEE